MSIAWTVMEWVAVVWVAALVGGVSLGYLASKRDRQSRIW